MQYTGYKVEHLFIHQQQKRVCNKPYSHCTGS